MTSRKPLGRSLAGSKLAGAEFVAMMGSGVGVVFELMLGRDADLWPADSSTGQAGRASGLQVHDSQVAPLSGMKYSAIEPPMNRGAIRADWLAHPVEGQ